MISLPSCGTPGDNTPAVLLQEEIKREVKEIIDAFVEVIANSSLSEVRRTEVVTLLGNKLISLNEKIDLVVTYLMSIDDLDYSKVAKDVAARLKEIYDTYKDQVK